MEWKEILKISIIVGVVSSFLTFTLESYGSSASLIINPLLGVIATGLMLNKKLSNKSEWGILIGMIITGLVIVIVDFIGKLIF
mgnify:CR=1 FL=1